MSLKRLSLLISLLVGLANGPAFAAPRLQFGIGDRYDQVINGKRVVIYREAMRDGLRFKYVALWLTPGWPGWITPDLLRRIVRDGYTPLLIYYTFGDRSSREYLEANDRANLKAWFDDIEHHLAPTANIDTEVLIALEPEFNVIPASGTPLTQWPEWDTLAAQAIDTIHRVAPRAKVGFCPGDWGNTNLEPALHTAALKSDFLAFPEMRAATDPTRNTADPKYRNVASAAVQFSAYLKKTFGKPILFSYLALSSYAGGNPRGWESVQARILNQLFDREAELVKNGVFALAYFSYFDNPDHGTEFFGQAEKYFGLKDATGRPKKAWTVWKERTR